MLCDYPFSQCPQPHSQELVLLHSFPYSGRTFLMTSRVLHGASDDFGMRTINFLFVLSVQASPTCPHLDSFDNHLDWT